MMAVYKLCERRGAFSCLQMYYPNSITIEKGAEVLEISVQEMSQKYSEYRADR